MTLKVSMDPSTSSRAKSLCPVSLTTPHGGLIMCPIWLLCGGDARCYLQKPTPCFTFLSSVQCIKLIFKYFTDIVHFIM